MATLAGSVSSPRAAQSADPAIGSSQLSHTRSHAERPWGCTKTPTATTLSDQRPCCASRIACTWRATRASCRHRCGFCDGSSCRGRLLTCRERSSPAKAMDAGSLSEASRSQARTRTSRSRLLCADGRFACFGDRACGKTRWCSNGQRDPGCGCSPVTHRSTSHACWVC